MKRKFFFAIIGLALLVLAQLAPLPVMSAHAISLAGKWSPTGSMSMARAGQTAVLLLNGKVLVAGTGSAELYDPATGKWSPTGSMSTLWGGYMLRLLNGKVLMVGTMSAELYNPASGKWSPTGSMSTIRGDYTLTLLANGKVLAAGGANKGDGILSSAELYDPAFGTWWPTGSMTTPRVYAASVLLPNGHVLVLGGDSGHKNMPQVTEAYDPLTGTWSALGSISTGRSRDTAALLPDGKVLLVGGELIDNHYHVPLTSAELYDPVHRTLSVIKHSFIGGPITVLANGQVLVGTQLYTPLTGKWSAIGHMSTARYAYTATLLPAGNVLVAGGFDPRSTVLASSELFSLSA